MSELQELQNKEIEILQAIHDACEKLGLRYTLIFGSLLGAVRHKGFIPWDDDVDIYMPREDYDIFMEKGQQFLPDNMRIQHHTTEADCPNIYAKVRDNTTTFLHREHIDLDINHGVFVDIFPVDRMKNSSFRAKCEFNIRKLFNMVNGCYDKAYVDTIVSPVKKIIALFIHHVVCKILVQPSRADFIRREEQRRRNLNINSDDCTFLCLYQCKTIEFSVFWERELFEFGDHLFYAPKETHRILSETYGDYMQLPPENKRITHKPLYLDLTRGLTKKEIKELGIGK